VETLDELVRSTRRARRRDEVAAGMFEGLTGAGPPRLERGPEESTRRFAARLLGRFLAWVDSTGRPLDDALRSSATPYLSAVAALVADGDWDVAARDPRALLRTHTIAMIFVERRSGVPTPAGPEFLLVSWLAGQASLRPTSEASRRVSNLRRRRLEKRFGPPAEGSGPPA